MNWRSVLTIVFCLALFAGCDRRRATTRNVDTDNFFVDLTIIKDLSTGYNLASVYFERNDVPLTDAVITVGTDTLPNAGGGYYYINDPAFNLPTGINTVTFESPDDSYTRGVIINIPGLFGIEDISPQYNNAGNDVFVSWSAASGASEYLLVVATLDYGFDGTSPFFGRIHIPERSAVVPDTTFEDINGDIVDAVYYVYVIAFNQGLGTFVRFGPEIPMPDGLPIRTISTPTGILRYGTVAPIDSIIVSPI